MIGYTQHISMPPSAVDLLPEDGVDRIAGEMSAATAQPWLRIVQSTAFCGKWIRLRYRSSYFDDPVRPLLRFARAGNEDSFDVLNGPVLGASAAIVRVPNDAQWVSISPVAEPGRFDFAIDAIEPVSRSSLLAYSLRRQSAWTLTAIGAALVRARQEAHTSLRFAAGSTPLEDYDAWHRALARPLDLGGFDRPRTDWRTGPIFRLIIPLQGNDGDAVSATLNSLRAQVYARWMLHAVCGSEAGADVVAAYHSETKGDSRVVPISPESTLEKLPASTDEWFAVIGPGDILPNYALAVIAETAARRPGTSVIYGDEDSVNSAGLLHSPVLKPNWSPTFEAATSYIGRLTCIRCADLIRIGCTTPEQVLAAESELATRIAKLSGEGAILHIRRILYRCRRERLPGALTTPIRRVVPQSKQTVAEQWPTVTVIIPTRNRADYLRRCIAGLRHATEYGPFDVIVVDNGSTEAGSIALLNAIEKDPKFTVLRVPGPFNFSLLCNRAAAETKSDILVLLNNDVEIFESGWLKALIPWTLCEEVGAVGAKLLYPNGGIQHAGIVIGAGGRAGHLYRGASGDEPGYLAGLRVVHEQAAVTGACLAVERSKFEAVGGLESDLPVDLNDVDFCLRLSERGWRTIWTPAATLRHTESGTRGYPLHAAKVYQRERNHFIRRWLHVIRDDPYFHPALSLFSRRPALAPIVW